MKTRRTYKILKYCNLNGCHLVMDDAGDVRYVDVMVHGDFPEGTDPESLVRKEVECEYEHPYIAIAMKVKVVEK